MLLWVVITCRPLVMEQSCAEHFILFIKSSCLFCDGWGSWDQETKVIRLGDTAWICSHVSQVPNIAYHHWVSIMGRVWVPSFHFCFLQNSFKKKKSILCTCLCIQVKVHQNQVSSVLYSWPPRARGGAVVLKPCPWQLFLRSHPDPPPPRSSGHSAQGVCCLRGLWVVGPKKPAFGALLFSKHSLPQKGKQKSGLFWLLSATT